MAETSTNKNHSPKKIAMIFALVNFLTFLVYYLCFYIVKKQFTLYVYFYISELISAALPVIASSVLLVLYAKQGIKKPLLISLLFSSTWVFHLFPYYAFEYAYQMLEIYTVLTFSAIHTVFMIAIIYIEITLLYFLMIFLTEKIAKHNGMPYQKDAILKKSEALDFSNPVTVGIFSASSAMFIYNFVNEIVDTVSFLRDVDGAYETGEIIYIIFRYLFILAVLIISHFAAVFVKNKITVKGN